MNLVVQESRNGKGIFAARTFAPDETVYEVTGVFIAGDAEDDLEETIRDNAFRFSEDLYISPTGEIGDFQNHSCEPNAKVVKRDDRLYVLTVVMIRKGEEVLIDYSTIIGADDIWEMTCACGSASCRGIIQSFNTLPAELQNTYLTSGMVPAYISQ